MPLPGFNDTTPQLIADAIIEKNQDKYIVLQNFLTSNSLELSALVELSQAKTLFEESFSEQTAKEAIIPVYKGTWVRLIVNPLSESTLKINVLQANSEKRKDLLIRGIIELFNDVIFELDVDLNFMRVYAKEQKHLFMPYSEIKGKNINQLFQGDLLNRFLLVFNQARTSGKRQVIEYQSPFEGDNRWFRADIILVHDDDVPGYFLVAVSDITERKKTRDALKYHSDFEELLVLATSILIQSDENTFDKSLEGVLKKIGQFSNVDRSYFFKFNEDGISMSNTHEWCAIDVSPERENLQNVPIDFAPMWMAALHRNEEVYINDLNTLPEAWAQEKSILEPQGIKSLLAVPVKASNILYGFIGFDAVNELVEWDTNARHLLKILADNLGSVIHRNAQNLTLKKANEEATRLAVEASAASKAKSDFLANMSHEIRTPLNGVVGFTELLKTTKLTLLQEQYANNVEDSAQSLIDIINQILDFSKIESGKLLLDLESSDFIPLIENACMLVRHASGVKGLDFELNFVGKIPEYVLIDSIRLRQVLVNLLSNAIKFTHQGSVTLTIEEIIKPESALAHIKFTISDTGIGISEEQSKFLFKAFMQADNTTTKKFGGTGLGLVISNNLLEMMGSELQLKSSLGVGSEFSFELALTVAEKNVISREEIPGYIAVVSDDSVFMSSISGILQRMQIALKEFNSYESFLDHLTTSNLPSVVISIEAQDSSEGIALIKKLKGYFKGQDALPFATILYYRKEDVSFHETARLLNVDATLQLPTLPFELRKTIQECIQEKSSKILSPSQRDLRGEFQTRDENISILVVEDNEVNLLLTKIVMGQCFPNASISEARDGLEALTIMVDERFDVVLMDMQMPKMDGYEAIQRARAMGLDMPIISLTANAIIGERERCLEVGATEYVTKPMSKESIKTIIEKLILI